MMGDMGLAILSGLMHGAAGFPKGLQESAQNEQALQRLGVLKSAQEESARHNLATEEVPYVDIPDEQGGTKRVNRALLPYELQKRQALRDQEQSRQMGEAISNVGAVEGPPPEAAMGPGAPIRDPQMEALGKVIPFLSPTDASKVYIEHMKEQSPKLSGATVQGPEGAYNVIRDRQGNVTQAKPMGIPPAEGKSPFQRSDVEAAMTEAGWTPQTPGYRQAYLDVARQIPVAGAGVFGAGQMVIPPPPSKTRPTGQVAPTPGASRIQPRLPIGSSAPEVTARSEQQYSVDELRDLAGALRAIAPSDQARLSLATRKILQGLPVAEVSQQLTPEEQDLLSRLGHAQMRYEKALAGVRGAASPQMYDRIKKIFGSPTSATTPDGLEGLANALDHFMQTEQGAEASSGRPVIRAPSLHTPSRQPAPITRWGRDANGNPVRLP